MDQDSAKSTKVTDHKQGKLALIATGLKEFFHVQTAQKPPAPSLPVLSEQELTATLRTLKDNAPELLIAKDAERTEFSRERFVAEALECGIKVFTGIPDGDIAEHTGSIIILEDIGKNARVTVRNGSLIILGNVGYGAILETQSNPNLSPSVQRAALPVGREMGITVAGVIDDHARLTSSNNIIIGDAGNFVQLRAAHIIKAANLGRGANLMAQEQIEADYIGDDLRSTHFTNSFIAKGIGNRAIIKATSISVGDVGGGSEFVATYGIEAGDIGENCTFTARTILVRSVSPNCQLYSALGVSESGPGKAYKS